MFQYGRTDWATAPHGGSQSLTINIIFFHFYLSQDWCFSMVGRTALQLPMVLASPYQLILFLLFLFISGLVFQYGRTDCATASYGGSQSLPINIIFITFIYLRTGVPVWTYRLRYSSLWW